MRAVDFFGRIGLLATLRRRPFIAIVRTKTVIYIALEIAGAMKPRTGANEAVAIKPFRALIASGSTSVRSAVIVSVGTIRGNADGDIDLSFRFVGGSREADNGNGS